MTPIALGSDSGAKVSQNAYPAFALTDSLGSTPSGQSDQILTQNFRRELMYNMDVMDDLFDDAYSPTGADLGDGFEDLSAFEEEDGLEGYEAYEGYEDSLEDYGAEDSLEDYGEDLFAEQVDTDALEDLVADALDAQDTEEFLRRISRIARQAAKVARRVGQGVGQVARVVAPIASAIPLPQAQAIGRIASIAGRLLADGADEFELLDSLFDLAEEEGDIDAAAPVLAGLTVRTTMPRVTQAARPVRRQVVRSVSQATRTIAHRQGVAAARAIPQVVRTVQQTAAQRRLPARQLPQAIRSAAARVAASPQLTRRMTQTTRRRPPSPVRARRATALMQRYSIGGPVEIIIRRR